MFLHLTRQIWVTDSFSAQHRWKDCPYEEVAFLRHWHRHIFQVKVTLNVSHDNRDLEFFMVKRLLKSILLRYEGGQHDLSCEMMAEQIGCSLNTELHTDSVYSVEVSEDGENGSIVYWNYKND